MKIFCKVEEFEKNSLYETYCRVISKPKKIGNITKKEILKEIYDWYKDYTNIIRICTLKELNFLDSLVNKKEFNNDFLWSLINLRDKLLIYIDDEYIYVPEEIEKSVRDAVKNVDIDEKNKEDNISIKLITLCKVNGICDLNKVVSYAMKLLDSNYEEAKKFIINSNLFLYYVALNEIDGTMKCVYIEYLPYKEKLNELQKKYDVDGNIDDKNYEDIFYHDFDMSNKNIKKLLDSVEKDDNMMSIIYAIKMDTLLNKDRSELKKNIKENSKYSKDILSVLDIAMDDMPSGALHGLTPNQYKNM